MRIKKPKKTNLFWLYIVVGIIFTIISIMLAPIWQNTPDWVIWKSWGMSIINLIIAAVLLIYLFGYLVQKIIKGPQGVTKVLTIVEFVILFLVAVGSVLSQFKIINVGGACRIFGLALWIRGCIECVRGYYYRHESSSKTNYPVWYFSICLAMVTFGTYCFAKPFIQDVALLWIFVALILLTGISFIAIGIMSKPTSRPSK